jgi:hypothetical protein
LRLAGELGEIDAAVDPEPSTPAVGTDDVERQQAVIGVATPRDPETDAP